MKKLYILFILAFCYIIFSLVRIFLYSPTSIASLELSFWDIFWMVMGVIFLFVGGYLSFRQYLNYKFIKEDWIDTEGTIHKIEQTVIKSNDNQPPKYKFRFFIHYQDYMKTKRIVQKDFIRKGIASKEGDKITIMYHREDTKDFMIGGSDSIVYFVMMSLTLACFSVGFVSTVKMAAILWAKFFMQYHVQ